MALKPPPGFKPPPIAEVLAQVNDMVGPGNLLDEVDRNTRQLVQSALRKLDFVSREEFDAQSAILARTRSKVAALESELAAMSDVLEKHEKREQP